MIALCSLAFAGIPLVSTLGFTAAIAVVVAVLAAITLLPAHARRPRPAHQLAAGARSARPIQTTRSPTAGCAGQRAWPPGPGARRSPRSSSSGPRGAGDPARTGPERHRRAAQVDDLSPGLRRARQGLRPRLQRPAADRIRIQDGRRGPPGAARPREEDLRATHDVAAVGSPTFDKTGRVAVFTRHLELGAVGQRNGRTGRRPAGHGDPEGDGGDAVGRPTSAARPPATSISPPRSPTSCR